MPEKPRKSATDLTPTPANVVPDTSALLGDVRAIIQQARERAAVAVNTELTLMHWHIGDRIRRDILGEERAAYGEQIVQSLSAQLTQEYGRGYSKQNLLHMVRFAEIFCDASIVSTLSRQLGWSHFKEIIYLEHPLKRDFYAEMCRVEKWSVRALRAKIDGMLYERTTLSGRPEEVIEKEIQALREDLYTQLPRPARRLQRGRPGSRAYSRDRVLLDGIGSGLRIRCAPEANDHR
jgi:hypothetical protein